MSTNVIASQPIGRLPDPAKPADVMLTAPILPTLVRLSLPNMLAMLAMALVAIAETAYVGTLGTPPLAGLALVFPLVMLQQMMSAAPWAAASPRRSAARSAPATSDGHPPWHFMRCVIGCAFGVVSTIAMLLFGEPIYRLLGGRDAALTRGAGILQYRVSGRGRHLAHQHASALSSAPAATCGCHRSRMMTDAVPAGGARRRAWLRVGRRRAALPQGSAWPELPLGPGDRLWRGAPSSSCGI